MHTVVTIGGSDPSGCSGIQADLRAIVALGAHGATVVTAVTAQNTVEYIGHQAITPAVIAAQLDAVFSDLDPVAVKIGMLPSAACVEVVRASIDRHRPRPLVIDPVLESSTGGELGPAAARSALLDLLARADLVTPNAPELAALAEEPVDDPESAVKAARKLLARGTRAVLAKGGHFERCGRGTDVLVTAGEVRVYESTGLDVVHTRGSGCMLASAVATFLGTGEPLADAIAHARRFVRRALAFGYGVGAGPGPAHALVGRTSARTAALGRLHVLTDPSRDAPKTAAAALAGGADVIQVRDKRPSVTSELVGVASAVRKLCAGHAATCIVDDRADVAEAAGAHGVHLGRDDLDPAVARRVLGPLALVGSTVHDLDEARAALRSPIDYLGVGPIFETTSTHVRAGVLGLDGLRAIVAASPLPVIAIAGITPERVGDVLAAGAYGIAVLSGVTFERDPERAARSYARAIESAIGGWR